MLCFLFVVSGTVEALSRFTEVTDMVKMISMIEQLISVFIQFQFKFKEFDQEYIMQRIQFFF